MGISTSKNLTDEPQQVGEPQTEKSADLIFEKLLSHFPERNLEQFREIWNTKVINQRGGPKENQIFKFNGYTPVSTILKHIGDIVEPLNADEKAILYWIYNILQEWYLLFHGDVFVGLKVFSMYFNEHNSNITNTLNFDNRIFLKHFYEFIYERIFIQDYLDEKLVKDEAVMDFAVHFARFLRMNYQDKSVYLVVNAIMQHRNSWAPWLTNLLSSVDIFANKLLYTPQVPSEFTASHSDTLSEGGGLPIIIYGTFLETYLRDHTQRACTRSILPMFVDVELRTASVDVSYLKYNIQTCPFDTFILPVRIVKTKENSHSNIIIFNRSMRTVEHFEPHGGKYQQQVDNAPILEQFIKTEFPKWQYISPSMLCPKILASKGPQHSEVLFGFSMTGYCALWSLYYVILRILNPNKTSDETYIYLTKHPGIFLEIRRFRCLVLDTAMAEFEQGRYHGYDKVTCTEIYEKFSQQRRICVKRKEAIRPYIPHPAQFLLY